MQRRDTPDFVKILDFGIAKILEAESGRTLTAAGTVFGTPEYLAPEQGMGKPADNRADLYSVGVIMYRMLAGRLPFHGGNKRLIQRQISEPPLPFAQVHMPQPVPECLEKVCFKLLAKNPDDRYQTAEDVQDALHRCDLRPPELIEASRRDIQWIDLSDGSQIRDQAPPARHVPTERPAPPAAPAWKGPARYLAAAAGVAAGAAGLWYLLGSYLGF